MVKDAISKIFKNSKHLQQMKQYSQADIFSLLFWKNSEKMAYKEPKMFIEINVRTLSFIPHFFHYHLWVDNLCSIETAMPSSPFCAGGVKAYFFPLASIPYVMFPATLFTTHCNNN